MQGTIAVIGCLGFNFGSRILPGFQKLDPRSIIGYNLVEVCRRELG